jgi:hypothetical protein
MRPDLLRVPHVTHNERLRVLWDWKGDGGKTLDCELTYSLSGVSCSFLYIDKNSNTITVPGKK